MREFLRMVATARKAGVGRPQPNGAIGGASKGTHEAWRWAGEKGARDSKGDKGSRDEKL